MQNLTSQAPNFKIWRSTGPMQLAPLTLVFGTNSSGKSSLIQSLLLLRQTVNGQDPNLDLNFGNPDANDSVVLGQFGDVLCHHGAATEAVKAKQIGIEFGWRTDNPHIESPPYKPSSHLTVVLTNTSEFRREIKAVDKYFFH